MHRLLVALLLSQGCAFGIQGPDPDRPRSQMPKCDTGKAAVALDGAMAAIAGMVALGLASDNEPAIALLPLSIGALYTAGAVKGNNAANACREAMTDFESYVAERDALPADTTPPRTPTRAEATAPPPPQPVPQPAATVPPPVVAAPAPPVAPPANAPAAATKKPAARAEPAPAQDTAADDDWSAFWKEVP